MEDRPPQEQAQSSSTENVPTVGDDAIREPDASAQNKQVRKRWEDVRVQWLGDKVMI
jgi:hypothetical protein